MQLHFKALFQEVIIIIIIIIIIFNSFKTLFTIPVDLKSA